MEAYEELKFFEIQKNILFLGGSGRGGGGVRGRCEQSCEVFVKIQKKKKNGERSGRRGDVFGGWGSQGGCNTQE